MTEKRESATRPEAKLETNPEKENKARVKPGWFKAYYKGNALLPQTGEGINMYLAIATVLEDEDISWQEFARSELSAQQLEFLGNAMSAMHKRSNVNVSTKERAHTFTPEPAIVTEKVLQILWTNAKKELAESLLNFFSAKFNELNRRELDNYSTEIQRYFDDPKEQESVAVLKKALLAIKSTLGDPEMQKLLAEYKSELRGPMDSEAKFRLWYEGEYFLRFTEIIRACLKEAFNGEVPEELKCAFRV